jgi:hypothetical protein
LARQQAEVLGQLHHVGSGHGQPLLRARWRQRRNASPGSASNSA